MPVSFLSFLDIFLDMPKITKSHGSGKFIHFPVTTHQLYAFLPHNTEIFQGIKLMHKLRIFLPYTNCSPLYAVKNLGGMKGEHGGIAKASHSSSMVTFPKGVGSIIKHRNTVFLGNPIQLLHIANMPIDMYRQYSHRILANQGAKLLYIDGIKILFNIAEHRSTAISDDGMGGAGKGKGCGDNFSLLSQAFNQKF